MPEERRFEVWKTCSVDGLDEMVEDEARYQACTRQIGTLCNVFNDLGCRYGLYNHGGWGGEPETMAEIARRLQSKDIGIVYNFHHGHEHLERMPGAKLVGRPYAPLLPYFEEYRQREDGSRWAW